MRFTCLLVAALCASMFSGENGWADAAAAGKRDVAGAVQPTKTVYGFLDFTTTVSDTVMIFKPSKSAGAKSRTGARAGLVLSKGKGKIEASAPILEASAAPGTLDDATSHEEASRGRSASPARKTLNRSQQQQRPAEVQIEGSMITFTDEPASGSGATAKTALTDRLKVPRARPSEAKGTGSVVSSFPVMHSHVVVSSRVDIRIGGVSKLNRGASHANNQALPQQVEVRMEVNMANSKEKKSSSVPAGQSVVSKTTGTRIMNGFTTIHETSIIGTTINGQYAHFVQSTSTVFREAAATLAPGRAGSVEVVSHSDGESKQAASRLAINPTKPVIAESSSTPAQLRDEHVHVALPSLESLFESVSTSSSSSAKKDEPKADALRSKTENPPLTVDDDEQTSAVVLKPTFKITPTTNPPTTTKQTPTTTSGNIERRAGLAGSPSGKLRDSRPPRPDDQRWRYNPTPKQKVNIHRTSGSGSGSGSRFRDRVATSTTQQTPRGDADYDYPTGAVEPEVPDPTEVITLRVQSVTPAGYSNLFYEVVTVKSPYIMRLGAVRNTRFVTLTRTHTRLITPTPAPAFAVASVDIEDSGPESELGDVLSDEPSQPLLPDPENILATTAPYEAILKDSSDTATLPAIIVAATESLDELALSTVTETFSTTELMMKTSILPYLRAGTTSHMTLTQSYYVTRVVVAVKTVPPSDLYQFIPSKTLTDISTNLQEAGSEHNERLLPGELEFSENDEYSDTDDDRPRAEKRVPAPKDYLNNGELSSIGQDFDLASFDRKTALQQQQQQQQQVELEPSLIDTAAETTTRFATPPLPHAGQFETSLPAGLPFQQQQQQADAPVLSPEQLQQLALFRFMNPYAAAGLPFGYPGFGNFGASAAPQVITTSKPVVRTADVIRTETVPIWDGVKTIYSTITRTKGTTVVTETEYGTTTLPAAPVNPLFPQQQFTVMSSPVVTEVTTTSTELRIYRIIFRAQTTYTTVTSTTVFPTLVTSYVSSTIPIQPTAFPNLFPGNFPYPSFG